jgi:hypothetical protein
MNHSSGYAPNSTPALIMPGQAPARIKSSQKRSNTLGKPNFNFQKRQKELAKKKKSEEKRQRKLGKNITPRAEDQVAPPEQGGAK